MGHGCDVLLADALGGPRNPYVRQAVGPLVARRAVLDMFSRSGPYDIVDVASAEGLWLAAGSRRALNGAAVISRSNGLEHLNYQRMLDDHAAGLSDKPWTRRLFHPAVRLTQVAAAARAADRLLLLNESDRDYALERRMESRARIDVVAHGVSQRFLADAPAADARRGRRHSVLRQLDAREGCDLSGRGVLASVARSRPSTRMTFSAARLPVTTFAAPSRRTCATGLVVDRVVGEPRS